MDRLSLKRSMLHWERKAGAVAKMNLSSLRVVRRHARRLRHKLDTVIDLADYRLMRPLIGTDAIRRPQGADWAYRPEIWRKPQTPAGLIAITGKTPFGHEATVFHDCKISELGLRQIRNTRADDLAPFGLRLDVFAFEGSFLSVLLDLPEHGVQGFSKKHLLRLEATIELEKTIPMFARLNVKQGPNSQQLTREMPLADTNGMVEFDLSYTKLAEKPADRIWIELIFEQPLMNQMVIRDITFSRLPRAQL